MGVRYAWFEEGFQPQRCTARFTSMCSGLASLGMRCQPGIVETLGARYLATQSGVLSPLAYALLPAAAKVGFNAYIPTFLINVISAGGFITCNSRAFELERIWGKPIMSSFHAAFSADGLSASAIYSALLSHLTIGTTLIQSVSVLPSFLTSLSACSWTQISRRPACGGPWREGQTPQLPPLNAHGPLHPKS
eukprot:Blabericola_migrator_1__4219@NODE_2294_length_2988_cov_75_294420_g298_i10_p1_GENE_NODE_2294_length_2988_cov_75_294420_g298_i10NODE_2294_length_2988_cov_75_294420_g298_i10_p1_ORF_typecomplete_len192_score11_41_NODE_2294_length_2988_cov_75_294420_g298_i10169744